MDALDTLRASTYDETPHPGPALRERLQRVLRMALRSAGLSHAVLLIPGPGDWTEVVREDAGGDRRSDRTSRSGTAPSEAPHSHRGTGDSAATDTATVDAASGRPHSALSRAEARTLAAHVAREDEPVILQIGTTSHGDADAAAASRASELTSLIADRAAEAFTVAGIPLTPPEASTGLPEGRRPLSDLAPGHPWGVLLLYGDELYGDEPTSHLSTDVLDDTGALATDVVYGYEDSLSSTRYRQFIAKSDQGIYRFEVEPPIPTDLPVEEQVDALMSQSYLVECNETFARMYGYDSADDLTGLSLAEFYGEENRPANRDANREFVENGYRVSNGITREPSRDGTYRYFSSTAIGITIDGKLHRTWGLQQDVTELKETEAALHHSEQVLRTTLDSYPFATAIFDADLRYLYANERATQSIDVDLDAIVGERPESLLPEGIWQPLLPLLRTCRNEERFVQEEAIVDVSGHERHVIATFVPLFEEDEKLQTIIASTRDVTERRRAEQALRESEQRLSLHVEHSPLAFVEWNPEGRIVKWNPAAQATFGYCEDEARGLHFADLVPLSDRDAIVGAWNDVVRRRSTVNQHRIYNLTKGGRVIACEWSLTPLIGRDGDVMCVAATAQDVTQEIEARDALRQERDLLRSIAETSAAGIIVVDAHGRPTFVNSRAETILGTTRDALARHFTDGKYWKTSTLDGTPISDEDLPYARVMREDAPVSDVEMAVRVDGRRKVLSVNAAPVHDEGGQILQVVIVMEDITERTRRQVRIREHNETLTRVAKLHVELRDDWQGLIREAAQSAFDTLDVDRVSVWLMNQDRDELRCVEALGPDGSTSELSTTDVGLVLDVEQYSDYVESLRRKRALVIEDVEAATDTPSLMSYCRTRSIGALLDAPVRIGGELVGVVCCEHLRGTREWSPEVETFASSVADVVAQAVIAAEQKRARSALRRSERRWKSLVKHHPGGVIITIDGTYAYVNPAAASILGTDDPDELLGRSVETITVHGEEETVRERLNEVNDGRPTEPWEHEIVGLDGERRCVVTQSVPIIYRGRPAAQTVVRDVTERRRREQQLQEAKEEAQQMNRLKSAFLANMSHEIRTPLTAIIGFAELLGDEDTTHEEEISELIVESSQRLLRTLNSVLDLSRLESGSMHVSPDEFDFVELVRDATRLFQREAEKTSIALDVSLPDETCLVRLDPSALDRILGNLIGNSIKFTPEGGTVEVSVSFGDDQVHVSVADTGIGIDADFLPRVFEAFHQESTGMARSHEGTGLGLAITRRLTELMDGTISVESTKDVGTTFTVTLPRFLNR